MKINKLFFLLKHNSITVVIPIHTRNLLSGQVLVKARDSTPNFHYVNIDQSLIMSHIVMCSYIQKAVWCNCLVTTTLVLCSDAPPTRGKNKGHVGRASGHETGDSILTTLRHATMCLLDFHYMNAFLLRACTSAIASTLPRCVQCLRVHAGPIYGMTQEFYVARK